MSGCPAQQHAQVYKHRNLRLAYIAQQHMFHLAEFMNSTPYVYIQKRYQNGYDEAWEWVHGARLQLKCLLLLLTLAPPWTDIESFIWG